MKNIYPVRHQTAFVAMPTGIVKIDNWISARSIYQRIPYYNNVFCKKEYAKLYIDMYNDFSKTITNSINIQNTVWVIGFLNKPEAINPKKYGMEILVI